MCNHCKRELNTYLSLFEKGSSIIYLTASQCDQGSKNKCLKDLVSFIIDRENKE